MIEADERNVAMKNTWRTRLWIGVISAFCWGSVSLRAQTDGGGDAAAFQTLFAAVNAGTTGGDAVDPLSYSQVIVVADPDSNSLIVSAPEAILKAIEDLIQQLDRPVEEQTVLRVIFLQNADPAGLVDLLTTVFPDPDQSKTGWGTGSSAGFGPAPQFQPNGSSPVRSSSASRSGRESGRAMKLTKLVAIADSRTGSIIVNAPARMMPEVEALVAEIDSRTQPETSVAVIRLKNAATYDIGPILQGLVGSTTTLASEDQNNPLLNRSLFLSGGGSGATLGGTGGMGGAGGP